MLIERNVSTENRLHKENGYSTIKENLMKENMVTFDRLDQHKVQKVRMVILVR